MVKILNCYLYAKKSYGTLSKGAILFGHPRKSRQDFRIRFGPNFNKNFALISSQMLRLQTNFLKTILFCTFSPFSEVLQSYRPKNIFKETIEHMI